MNRVSYKDYIGLSAFLHTIALFIFFFASSKDKSNVYMVISGHRAACSNAVSYYKAPKVKKAVQEPKEAKNGQVASHKKEPVQKSPVIKNKAQEKKRVANKKGPQKKVEKAISKKKEVVPIGKESLELLFGDEASMSKLQMQVQEAILNVWQPPVGLPKDLACALELTINSSGFPTGINIVSKSGNLLFDLSILRAAKDFHLPKFLWGKKVTITLKA